MSHLRIFIDFTRLNKPIGFMLLFWPCSWGLTFAFSNNQNLDLPPNQTTTIERTYSFSEIKDTNGLPNNIDNIYLFQLFSHAHQLMERFDVEFYNSETGEIQLIYTALDYEHPPILTLNEHLQIQEGDYLKISATYNNSTDDSIGFGLLSTDEMMILFGYIYYD